MPLYLPFHCGEWSTLRIQHGQAFHVLKLPKTWFMSFRFTTCSARNCFPLQLCLFDTFNWRNFCLLLRTLNSSSIISRHTFSCIFRSRKDMLQIVYLYVCFGKGLNPNEKRNTLRKDRGVLYCCLLCYPWRRFHNYLLSTPIIHYRNWKLTLLFKWSITCYVAYSAKCWYFSRGPPVFPQGSPQLEGDIKFAFELVFNRLCVLNTQPATCPRVITIHYAYVWVFLGLLFCFV